MVGFIVDLFVELVDVGFCVLLVYVDYRVIVYLIEIGFVLIGVCVGLLGIVFFYDEVVGSGGVVKECSVLCMCYFEV